MNSKPETDKVKTVVNVSGIRFANRAGPSFNFMPTRPLSFSALMRTTPRNQKSGSGTPPKF